MPPISIETGFDLYTRSGRARAWREVVDNKPDVVVMAWPCDPWTVTQRPGTPPGVPEGVAGATTAVPWSVE
eukprot:9251431-Pyramimonas_sp.AAC.1